MPRPLPRRPLVVALALALLAWAALAPPAAAQTRLEVRDTVLVAGATRFGLNLGARNRWGDAQILKNLVDNPGFEAGAYGMVAHAAAGSSGQRFVQDFWDTTWNNDPLGIGQPAGFWDGAEWEIVYGPARGRSGRVVASTHEGNRYVYHLDSDGTAPETWDVLFLRRAWEGVSHQGPYASAAPGETRPGSPGRQSLRLVHAGEPWRASWSWYMDSSWRDGDRSSGKLLLVRGRWRLAFWARAGRDGAQLRARFLREGEADFIDRTLTLTTAWQRFELDTDVAPGADPDRPYSDAEYHPILGLLLHVPVPGDEVLVDDLWLGRADDTSPTVFADAFVERLRELRPGVLRNWSNQLGSTLAVQLAPPEARGTQGYRPHDRVPDAWSYSLHEFLDLCREVGAEPWYVIPPTVSTGDMAGLAEYLASPAAGGHPWADLRAALGQREPWTAVFPRLHLEFGNELWGAASGSDPFFGASLLGGDRLGRIAHDRFAALRAHPDFDPARFDLIIGGQAGYPGRQDEIEGASSNHDSLALAPYFGVLERWASDAEVFYPLFARPFDDVTAGRVAESAAFVAAHGRGTALSVYEINFHTTDGPAPLAVRNDFVTGQGGALALTLHLLENLRAFAAREQCAFSSLGYSYRMASGEHVRVWGLLRDLLASGRKRPTWLGLELVNRVAGGDLLEVGRSGDDPGFTQVPVNGVENPTDLRFVQAYAFRQGARLGVVLFNLSLDRAREVELVLPPGGAAGDPVLWQLAPASIHDDNEDAEAVVPARTPLPGFASPWRTTLPPHSLSVLEWPGCDRAGIAPLASLRGVRDGADAMFSWSADPAADGYNLWVVGAPAEIAAAREGGSAAAVCRGVSAAPCRHGDAVDPAAGPTLYYQVRGSCGGAEAAE